MLQGLRFLLRQGIAIRGHFEEEGNLRQLLLAWSSSCKDLQEWNKEGKYMSHEIINEFIKLMGNTVLRNIITNIKSCEQMKQQTSQMNVCIRYVDDEYVVNEDSLGVHCIPNIKAETLFVALKNVLACCGLSLSLCRGQAYDGASVMQGRRKGLATLIKTEVPAALLVHCLAHSLNLCLQDASRKILLLRDAIDLVREIAKLINLSPKRKYLFNEKLLQCEDREVNGIRPLCPTRWTVRTGAIDVVVKSYATILDTLEEIYQTTHDEYGVKAAGLLSTLDKFETYFGLKLSHLLFAAAEEVSKVLQTKNLSVQEAVSSVNVIKRYYKQIRKDEDF